MTEQLRFEAETSSNEVTVLHMGAMGVYEAIGGLDWDPESDYNTRQTVISA